LELERADVGAPGLAAVLVEGLAPRGRHPRDGAEALGGGLAPGVAVGAEPLAPEGLLKERGRLVLLQPVLPPEAEERVGLRRRELAVDEHAAEGGVEPAAARLDAPRLDLGEGRLDPALLREPAVGLLGAAGARPDDLGRPRFAAVLLPDARRARPIEPGHDLLPEGAEEVVVAPHDLGREAGVLGRVEVEPLE